MVAVAGCSELRVEQKVAIAAAVMRAVLERSRGRVEPSDVVATAGDCIGAGADMARRRRQEEGSLLQVRARSRPAHNPANLINTVDSFCRRQLVAGLFHWTLLGGADRGAQPHQRGARAALKAELLASTGCGCVTAGCAAYAGLARVCQQHGRGQPRRYDCRRQQICPGQLHGDSNARVHATAC